jgi:hypothetical protein
MLTPYLNSRKMLWEFLSGVLHAILWLTILGASQSYWLAWGVVVPFFLLNHYTLIKAFLHGEGEGK